MHLEPTSSQIIFSLYANFRKIASKCVMMSEFNFYRKTSSSGYKPSYWHNIGTEPLSHLTVGQLVDIAAERWGVREALVSVYQGHRFTFIEARNKVSFITNKWGRVLTQIFLKCVLCISHWFCCSFITYRNLLYKTHHTAQKQK